MWRSKKRRRTKGYDLGSAAADEPSTEQAQQPAPPLGLAAQYSLLGLTPTRDIRAVRAAYRKAALQQHPDKGGDAQAFRELVDACDAICSSLEECGGVVQGGEDLGSQEEESWTIFAHGGIFAECDTRRSDKGDEEAKAKRRAGRAERKRQKKQQRREQQSRGRFRKHG